MDFRRFRVLTFDCYGTLIDWESGIVNVLKGWARRTRLTVSDEALLEAYGEAEPRCEQGPGFRLYPDVLRAVHAEIARKFGKPSLAADAEALAQSVGDWPAFADTPGALRRLQQRYKLVVVSNVDKASFARTHLQLGVRMDAVVTAEEVGAYKPDFRMFRRAFEVAENWGAAPQQVLHVAQSLYHDHVPAKSLGLTSVWVNRRAGKQGQGATKAPGMDVKPDVVVSTLTELASLAGV